MILFIKMSFFNFSNDFANGKIDTIMGLATLSLHLRKGGFSTKYYAFFGLALRLCLQTQKYGIPLSRYTVFFKLPH